MDKDERPQPGNPSGGATDPEATLLELAMQLIAARYTMVSGGQPQLLVGQLPPDLSVPIPMPEGCRIIGTLLSDQVVIVVEAPQPPEQTRELFRKQLSDAGWNAPPQAVPRGGFVHSQMVAHLHVLFIRGDEEPTLMLVVIGESSAPRSTVHLTLRRDPGHAATLRRVQGRNPQQMWDIVPPLLPPPGASQLDEGGSGGGATVISYASLQSDLDIAAVAQHYSTQLAATHGWQKLGDGVSGPVGWSSWTFTTPEGEPGHALCAVLAMPDAPGQFALSLRAELTNRPGGIGSFSFAQLTSGGWSNATSAPPKPS